MSPLKKFYLLLVGDLEQLSEGLNHESLRR